MNKTIFNLTYKNSLIAISILGVILAFLSNAFYVDNFIELILYIFRFALFISIYLIFYILEKNNEEFKLANKRVVGYLVVSGILNSVFAVFCLAHILPNLFLSLNGIICFILIYLFAMEIVGLFVNNNFVNKILNTHKKIGLFFASPIVKYVDKKITND